jgi:Ca-activated chloride channel family protein
MLAHQLNERDRVAMVVYAGAAGLVLPSTAGDRQADIVRALDQLRAGGSTNGGAGIQLAYRIARENRITGGVNRVILCTDGDFNVGVTSPGDLVRMAEAEAKQGVMLTVLGFGMGNHNDAMLEELSGKANGNYAFIDSESEARKIFVEQLSGTLETIAKDVKVQIEFNPAWVAAYRLIGYENRLLAAQDFRDDGKDAGEVGAGHTVTALYELVPAGGEQRVARQVDELKYQGPRTPREMANEELMTVKLRYKQPESHVSQLMTSAVPSAHGRFGAASADFRFAASVAAFGMVLRDSKHRGDVNLDAVSEIATAALGPDRRGYRREFLELIQAARRLRGEPVEPIGAAPDPTIRRGHVTAAPAAPLDGLAWMAVLGIVTYLALSSVLAAGVLVVLAIAQRNPQRVISMGKS